MTKGWKKYVLTNDTARLYEKNTAQNHQGSIWVIVLAYS